MAISNSTTKNNSKNSMDMESMCDSLESIASHNSLPDEGKVKKEIVETIHQSPSDQTYMSSQNNDEIKNKSELSKDNSQNTNEELTMVTCHTAYINTNEPSNLENINPKKFLSRIPLRKQNSSCSDKDFSVCIDHDVDSLNNEQLLPTRRASLSQVAPVLPEIPGTPHRETITSLVRKDFNIKLRNSWSSMSQTTGAVEYRTPLQRKDDMIRDLRQDIGSLEKTVNTAEIKLRQEHENAMNKLREDLNEKEQQILKANIKLRDAEKTCIEFAKAQRQSVLEAERYRKQVCKLEQEMEQREKQHQKMYLATYKKGQDLAHRQRLDSIEDDVRHNSVPDSKTFEDLLEKLEQTETQLSWWQTVARKEVYENAASELHLKHSETDINLRFLRDALYHFLMTEGTESFRHLRAMIGICKFTDVQMTKIRPAFNSKLKKFGKC